MDVNIVKIEDVTLEDAPRLYFTAQWGLKECNHERLKHKKDKSKNLDRADRLEAQARALFSLVEELTAGIPEDDLTFKD